MISEKKVYRLSFTTLQLWSKGETDEAIASYLGRGRMEPTARMQLGKDKHKLWEGEILRTGHIPVELGGQPLRNPIVERKHVRELDYGDFIIQLVGVLDLEDFPVIYDWKVSMSSPSSWLSSPQKLYYKLLLPEAERFEWRVWNPLTKEYGVVWSYLYREDMDKGLDWVLTYATDFISTYELMVGEQYNDNF
jgi:hypothetical protein